MNPYKKQRPLRLFSLIGHRGSEFAERIVKKYRLFKGKNMLPELIFLRWIHSGERSRNEDAGKSIGKEWKIDYHFKSEFFFKKMLRTFNKYAVMNYIKNFYRSSEMFFKPNGTASLQDSFKVSDPETGAHRDSVSQHHGDTIIPQSLFYAFSGVDRMLSAPPSGIREMDGFPGNDVARSGAYKTSVSLKQGARSIISPLVFHTLKGASEFGQIQKSEIFQPGYTPVLWHWISIQNNRPEKSAYNIAKFGKNLKMPVINSNPALLIQVNPAADAADNTGVKKPGIRDIGSEYRFSEIVHTENMTSPAVDITRNAKLELKDTPPQKTAVKSSNVSQGRTSIESTPGELELTAIADTVYRLIERRLFIEKEKRGFI